MKTLQNNEDLDLKQLTLKLSILLALTSASRASEMSYLNIEIMAHNEEKYLFGFPVVTKNSRQNRPRPDISYVCFPEDRQLCVVKTLDCYISKTSNIRGQVSQLLISYIKPHDKVSVSTVSRWIKDLLKDAGIDTTKFTGHSTRSASTSKAQVSGVSLEDILSRAHWSSSSTFTKHYNKKVSMETAFQNAVLSHSKKL